MKKILCILLAVMLLLSLAACSGTDSATDATEAPAAATSQGADQAETEAPATAADIAAPTDTIPGVLYQLNVEDGDTPIIWQLSLSGNRHGTSDGVINNRPLSGQDVAFIFELNEWIAIVPDTDLNEGVTAYIVPHETDPAVFDESYTGKIPDEAPRAKLVNPENGEDPLASWGDFYANPDDWQPGYYDIVFVTDNLPTARIMIKLYAEGELDGLSDDELQSIMDEELAAAKE